MGRTWKDSKNDNKSKREPKNVKQIKVKNIEKPKYSKFEQDE